MRAMVARALALLLLVLAGCPSPHGSAPARPRRPPPLTTPGPGSPPAEGEVVFRRVETAAAMPPAPPIGRYQIHLIDVGTGLAILIRGADFAMLYDAGTNDREERPLRVLAYLAAALGPSGDDLCVPRGAPEPGGRLRIDHVVLSHPHLDHASALDLVLHCYDVADFWDSGRVADTAFYRDLLDGIARSAPTTYHTAADVPADHARSVKGHHVTLPHWDRFSEGHVVTLGQGARFTVLHAEPKARGGPNQSSLVLLVELGSTRLLLVGDAESGERRDPSYPAGELEEYLIEHHTDAIRAHVLQVGHHGSKTSSRRAFLGAVKPKLALVSSGPKRYGPITLPDPEVIEELAAAGAKILRTDEHDADCPVSGRIGGDRGPGGCDSWVVEVR
jgi:competence protein ComEC